ncbi:cell division protein FtsQ/DivIB [Plasticicumulans acidivorans]|uniref:Cell division protein FtsQ n=1 Tax=Plasticicumulans acidivorans TaxID=886464 RepID=A0A317MV68_9GAMM|nr:cell division protein FtsQ/DivIB [Plasticicumulans acidivorans]PWV61832.1 cell division protein FtsQ [Plasticicumulans acidivorans]
MSLLRRRRKRGAVRTRHEAGEQRGWKLGSGASTVLRVLGTLAAFAGIAWGGVRTADWMLREGEFPLRKVTVDGDLRNLGPEDAEAVVRPYLGRNFFRLDMRAMREGFAGNPWVESVDVTRRWPDTVAVRFVERVPFAKWGTDGDMLDTRARVFRPGKLREQHDWPQLSGPPGHEALLMDTYGAVNRRLAALSLKVVDLRQDARGAWSMHLDNDIELYLGREAFAERLDRFVDVYPQVLAADAGRIAGVDLRYLNGFAVRWKSASGSDATHAGTARTVDADAWSRRTAGLSHAGALGAG